MPGCSRWAVLRRIESPTRFRIRALCGVCSTLVNKVQNIRSLAEINSRFDIQQLTGEHLLERAGLRLNSDLETQFETAPEQPEE